MILKVDPFHPDPAAIRTAAEVIRRGGVVAFPTETVYGLGASALSEPAVRRIFQVKDRPAYNPLIVHVPDAGSARSLVERWPDTARLLAERFWPGPLTLVLPKRAIVPDLVTAGLATVAVRVPSHPVAQALLRAAGVPIAAPSANPFTGISATTAHHVRRTLGDRVDVIIDGGATPGGIESTVLDLSRTPPALLRPGLLGSEELAAAIGGGLGAGEPAGGEDARPSPGMLERHYAPRAAVRLFEPEERARTAAWLRDLQAGGEGRGMMAGALLRDTLDAPVDHPLPMPADPAAYARVLYAALHTLDEQGCDVIVIENVPDEAAWSAVRDRLRRAAGGL
jgi:L-threonylcarbamoyladenylate synthase